MEEDRDDLINTSDDDDSTADSGDEQTEQTYCINTACGPTLASPPPTRSKLNFIITFTVLLLSTTLLTIIFPTYLKLSHDTGDTYSTLVITSVIIALVLTAVNSIANRCYTNYASGACFKPPVEWRKLLVATGIYTGSCFFIVFGMSQNKVMCHIQDPLKSLTLVFSLIFYFLFCRKLMRLQSIFSVATMIIGLFISIDYSLCNRFRCRGMDIMNPTDNSGGWSSKTHTLWTIIYIIGLALFSGFYVVLERILVPITTEWSHVARCPLWISTVSRLVSSRDSSYANVTRIVSETPKREPLSFVSLVAWIHVLMAAIFVCFAWTDFIASIGNVNNVSQLLNYTKNEFLCLLAIPVHSQTTQSCAMFSLYGLMFILTYVSFALSSVHFLVISQSAVFTVATTTASLPLMVIWWSLFHVSLDKPGYLVWDPVISGELICALLGFPIVMAGLLLLCKSCLKEWELAGLERQRLVTSCHMT